MFAGRQSGAAAEVIISNQGELTGLRGLRVGSENGVGNFTITDSGSNITLSGVSDEGFGAGLVIGRNGGTGSFTAQDGATIAIGNDGDPGLFPRIQIAQGEGSDGTLVVDGENTRIVIGDQINDPLITAPAEEGFIQIGGEGRGIAIISNGGQVINDPGGSTFVGSTQDTIGELRVTGAGSLFDAGEALFVGTALEDGSLVDRQAVTSSVFVGAGAIVQAGTPGDGIGDIFVRTLDDIVIEDGGQLIGDIVTLGNEVPLDGPVPYTPEVPLPVSSIEGSEGNNIINGQSLDELINGMEGNDLLHGRNGDDVIVVGPGKDKNYGGAGNDIALFLGKIEDYTGLNFSGSNVHVVESLPSAPVDTGRDRLKAFEFFEFENAIMNSQTGDVIFKEDASSFGPGDSLSDLFPVETLLGTNADDNLDGTRANELVIGFAGDDLVHGKSGNDVIIIGAGRDKNYGGSGFDIAVFDGDAAGFSGVDGIRDAYRIFDTDPSNGDLGFDRVKAVEILAFDDAIFDTRTGELESFTSSADLAVRLEELITSADV